MIWKEEKSDFEKEFSIVLDELNYTYGIYGQRDLNWFITRSKARFVAVFGWTPTPPSSISGKLFLEWTTTLKEIKNRKMGKPTNQPKYGL